MLGAGELSPSPVLGPGPTSGSGATAALDLAGRVFVGLAIFVAADLDYQSALVFYNALLPAWRPGAGWISDAANTATANMTLYGRVVFGRVRDGRHAGEEPAPVLDRLRRGRWASGFDGQDRADADARRRDPVLAPPGLWGASCASRSRCQK